MPGHVLALLYLIYPKQIRSSNDFNDYLTGKKQSMNLQKQWRRPFASLPLGSNQSRGVGSYRAADVKAKIVETAVRTQWQATKINSHRNFDRVKRWGDHLVRSGAKLYIVGDVPLGSLTNPAGSGRVPQISMHTARPSNSSRSLFLSSFARRDEVILILGIFLFITPS